MSDPVAARTAGSALLSDPYRNKGTAFTNEERDRLGLHGLLPPAVEDLGLQLERVAVEYAAKTTDLERHIFLRSLQERNSVLFYSFVAGHLEEVLPVLYTPTVGLACQQWSRMYRRQHGLIVSWPNRARVGELLDHAVGDRDIDVVVVTDGERILGLGDLGVGGMGIPIGKLALYTAAGGLNPARTLPVLLDAGTDNEALLSDPLYLGWRHRRVRGTEYDELIDAFVQALSDRFPGVLLQWEDFARGDANRLLARHRNTICSFNDDIQGTAVVTTAAIRSGMERSAQPFDELRLVVVGAGSAGTGIATQVVRLLVAGGLSEVAARQRCWLVDRDGLIHEGTAGLLPFQRPFAHSRTELEAWGVDSDRGVDLPAVVRAVRPHALVGVTGQPGLFTEEVIRAQANGVDRPIVLPLSNPTPRAEAIPSDVLEWTAGAALIGTGSPFPPVTLGTATHTITQVNNLYVFPGIGLGVVAVGAHTISDGMLTAAAARLGELASAQEGDALLPPVSASPEVAVEVARAVASTAVTEGLAPAMTDVDIAERVSRAFWRPVYAPQP